MSFYKVGLFKRSISLFLVAMVVSATGSTTVFALDAYNVSTPDASAGTIWSVYTDDTYVYAQGIVDSINDRLLAYSFDGNSFTLLDSYTATGYANAIAGDGTYIYASFGDVFWAFSFNGTSLTPLDSVSSAYAGELAPADSGVYVVDNGLLTYMSFDGTSFETVATISGADYWMWSDDTYIYTNGTSDGVQVFDYSGGSFSNIAFTSTAANAQAFENDGTYLYVGLANNSSILAYSFDGTNFDLVGSDSCGSQYAHDFWVDGGGDLHVACYEGFGHDGTGLIEIYDFDGSTFSLLSTVDATNLSGIDVDGDSTYAYFAGGTYGLGAYSLFSVAVPEFRAYIYLLTLGVLMAMGYKAYPKLGMKKA